MQPFPLATFSYIMLFLCMYACVRFIFFSTTSALPYPYFLYFFLPTFSAQKLIFFSALASASFNDFFFIHTSTFFSFNSSLHFFMLFQLSDPCSLFFLLLSCYLWRTLLHICTYIYLNMCVFASCVYFITFFLCSRLVSRCNILKDVQYIHLCTYKQAYTHAHILSYLHLRHCTRITILY